MAAPQFTYKLFANGSLGDVVGDEEKAWVAYAEYIEAENARLQAEVARLSTPAGDGVTPANNAPLVPLEETPTTDASSSNTPPTHSENAVSPSNNVPLANTETATDPRRKLAEEELLRTPGDSNGTIGERIGASDEFVRRIRWELIAAGRLEAPSAVRRGGQHQSPGADDAPTEAAEASKAT